MERYEVHPVNPNQRAISKAVEALKQGSLVAYPTGMNYGVGCAVSSTQGVKNFNLLTQRLKRNRLHTIICNDISEVSRYAYISNDVFKIMKRLLPGPYTFILEASNLTPKVCQTRRSTIGVRTAQCPTMQALLSGINGPILNLTALHLASDELIEDPSAIMNIYANTVSVLLDAGPVVAKMTTVLDFSSGELVVVREGAGLVPNL